MTRVTIGSPPSHGGGGSTLGNLLERLRASLASRYAVERELSQGGSAIVYLAEDLRYRRRVAIKVLRPEISAVLGTDRFLKEIETVAQLQHPHIVPLYESGEADGLLYFIMPFIEGESLRHRLERDGRLTLADALAITRDVCAALSYAHAQKVVHRDIKPENILLIGGAAVVADFGIARAMRVAGEGRMTDVGMALGTPLYMSPEQARASDEVDSRSDIYSLACVLYEMLGGEPPFTGDSPHDVLDHHIRDVPRPIVELRNTVPPPIAAALRRALAKKPSDRFASVTAFHEAIRIDSGETTAPVAGPGLVRRLLLAAAAVVAVVFAVPRIIAATHPVDPDLRVVFPFTDRTGADARYGRLPDVLLYESMKAMDDIKVVDWISARDAWEGASGRDAGRRVVAAARRVKAGQAVWGEVSRAGDSLFVTATLYDARRGRVIRSHTAAMPWPSDAVGQLAGEVRGLLLELLLAASPELEPERWLGTSRLGALEAFAAGFTELRAWRLREARERFTEAVTLDLGYAQAHLWLAQVESWLGEGDRWRPAARAAGALAHRLPSRRDSVYALALASLADSAYQDACDQYRSALAADSSDALSWYGLGECQRRDDVVVPSAASPSGYAFRSSFEGAVRAYRRAFAMAPSLNYAFGTQVHSRAAAALFAEPHRIRSGRLERGAAQFRAYAGLAADTFAFVPYPVAATMRGEGVPATVNEAVARARGLLAEVAGQWARSAPRSPEAHLALSQVMERSGDLTGEAGALRSLGTARRLVTDTLEAARLARAEVRLRLKAGQYDAARRLADSMLAAWQAPGAEVARVLAPLAALLGRAELAARLAESRQAVPDDSVFDPVTGRSIAVPQALREAAARFTVYAAFGAPVESLAATERRARQLIVQAFPARDRELVRYALLGDGGAFAFFQLGPAALPPPRETDYLAPMLAAAGRGDTGSVRAGLRRLDSLRVGRGMRPADLSLLTTYHETLLYLALRDTSGAEAHLGPTLDGLPLARLGLLDDPLHAATVGRALALRSRLAAAAGDAATAGRDAQAVRALWLAADPSLQAELAGLPGPSR